jgi:two-component system, cell cycle sensor histidine kinase and response regulator CckA
MRDLGETPVPVIHHKGPALPDPAVCAAPRGRAGRTVLLVEDEPVLRELTEEMLADLGFTVLSAGDGEEALRLCRAHGVGIDLLVTDVMLPTLSGRELADRVLQINPGIRVLFTSGYTADVIGPRLGCDKTVAMLEKPYTHHSLSEKVERLMGQT